MDVLMASVLSLVVYVLDMYVMGTGISGSN